MPASIEEIKRDLEQLKRDTFFQRQLIDELRGEVESANENAFNPPNFERVEAGAGILSGRSGQKLVLSNAVPPFPWWIMSFGCSLSGNKFKVFAGSIVHEGKTRLDFSAETLDLKGDTEYVYAQCTRDLSQSTVTKFITHASTFPATTDTNYQFPLYKLTSADGGANYTIERNYLWDIHLDTPMV